MSRWRSGVPAGALAAVVVTWFAIGPAPVANTANGNGIKQFGIADVPGRATALFPGSTGARWIRLANAENFPILVRTVTAAVGKPVDSRGRPVPACPATSVRLDALAAPVTVPGNGTADVALTSHMLPGAPDACRAVTFPLTYTGTAVKL
ncbi:hypothetical protein SAMN04489727_5513 [Amycolatopsis tolypomycina]|uniref:Uncharacterized protein n=1 Tax=Amycolatopsis tolypomycina TaxID=208445 RepID=A0A1H4WB46_9PSEU|nr:hypothetical protein [Amycolatopsis tolypomycina]SEC89978.1 hypothetical protein SAMN04489727_5513 [Amycolatopsis tolypomycina]